MIVQNCPRAWVVQCGIDRDRRLLGGRSLGTSREILSFSYEEVLDMSIRISSRSIWLRFPVTMLILAACIILAGCSSSTTVDTGWTFDVSDFSETNARETLELALRNECSKSNVGITAGLTSALRIVASAPAVRRGDNWEFSYDQKTALVTPSGRVSGELLRDLISQCR